MPWNRSRRDFLGTGLAGVGAVLAPRRGRAALTSLTLIHETSLIPAFDAYFQMILGPAYEKATGIKVAYELVSAGALQAQVASAAETGSGPGLAQTRSDWPVL